MTILNVISLLVFFGVLALGIFLVRRARSAIRDASGLGDVIEEGQSEGDLIGSLGQSERQENVK
jgi:hypothetical protein